MNTNGSGEPISLAHSCSLIGQSVDHAQVSTVRGNPLQFANEAMNHERIMKLYLCAIGRFAPAFSHGTL